MTFAKQMLEAKETLGGKGHEVILAQDTEHYSNNPDKKLNYNEELKKAIEDEALKECFDKIKISDAILVLNYNKNNIKGYLGTSVLMEIAIAYYLNKKIYLLNEIDETQNYSLEVELVKPIILNNDLSKIK